LVFGAGDEWSVAGTAGGHVFLLLRRVFLLPRRKVTTQETALYHKITEMHKPKQDISRRYRKNQSRNREIAKKTKSKPEGSLA